MIGNHHSSFSMPSPNLLICEFCEKEGPKPVIWPEAISMKNADQWALKLISVQLNPGDIFILVDPETSERMVCLYSALLDNQYRGFTRTYCIAVRVTSTPATTKASLGFCRFRSLVTMLETIDRNLKSRNLNVFRQQANSHLQYLKVIGRHDDLLIGALKNLRLVDPDLCPRFFGMSRDDCDFDQSKKGTSFRRSKSLPLLYSAFTENKILVGNEEVEHLSLSRSIVIKGGVRLKTKKFYRTITDLIFAFMRGMSLVYIGDRNHWFIRFVCSILEQPLIETSETLQEQYRNAHSVLNTFDRGQVSDSVEVDGCYLNLVEIGGMARLPQYSGTYLEFIVRRPLETMEKLNLKARLIFSCRLIKAHLCVFNEWASVVAQSNANSQNPIQFPSEFGEPEKEIVMFQAWMLSSKNRHEFQRPTFPNKLYEVKGFCPTDTHWYFD
ncbi:hypothetical protein ACOME3_008039 [Neoechinorhynchus agilis]